MLKQPTVILLNRHVTAAAAWITCAGLVLGTGTLNAFVQVVKRAAANTTTLGDYASVATVFFAASALCISVAAAVWAVASGRMRSYGALALWVICTAVVSGLLSEVGLAAPSAETVSAALNAGRGTPLGWVSAVMGAFLTYYGSLTFVSGLGVGAIVGHLAHNIESSPS